MLTAQADPHSNRLDIVVDGKIDKSDMLAVIEATQQQIEKHGKLRILEEIRSIGMMTPPALWEDLKFGLSHMNDFSHCAVVADKRWIELWVKALDVVTRAQIRFFPTEELEAARAWLDEVASEPASPGA